MQDTLRTMKIAVIQFPGSNCDQDCLAWCRAVKELSDDSTVGSVWHGEASLDGWDAVVVPGGFSYGDYLRCGAIARFSPIMRGVAALAEAGGLVIGICNGFQILCEAGLLPGALIRNRGLRFVCQPQWLRVEQVDTPFTNRFAHGEVIQLPIAHGEGCYVADPDVLDTLKAEGRILMRYSDPAGEITDASNPNGSMEGIAGICNARRNVFGLMPHPDRAFEARLGGSDGLRVLQSMNDFKQLG